MKKGEKNESIWNKAEDFFVAGYSHKSYTDEDSIFSGQRLFEGWGVGKVSWGE